MADGSYTFAPIFISREGAGSVVEYPDAKLTLKDVVVNGNGTPIVSSTTQSRYGTGLIQVSGGAALVLSEGTVIENGTAPALCPRAVPARLTARSSATTRAPACTPPPTT